MKHSIIFFFFLLILNCNTNATSGFKIQIESPNTKISVDDEISISVSSTGKKIIDSVHYYLNGEKYEGEWKNEKRHGQGAYIHPNGKRYDGEWRDGYKWNIEYKNKYGQTLRRWENGVLQK